MVKKRTKSTRVSFPFGYTFPDASGEIMRIKHKIGEYDRLVFIINGGYMATCIATVKGKKFQWTPLLDQEFSPLGNSDELLAVKIDSTQFKPVRFQQEKADNLDKDVFVQSDDVVPRWWMYEVVNDRAVKVTLLGSTLDSLKI